MILHLGDSALTVEETEGTQEIIGHPFVADALAVRG